MKSAPRPSVRAPGPPLDRVRIGRIDGVGGANLQTDASRRSGSTGRSPTIVEDSARDPGTLDHRLADAAASDDGHAGPWRPPPAVFREPRPGPVVTPQPSRASSIVGQVGPRPGTIDAWFTTIASTKVPQPAHRRKPDRPTGQVEPLRGQHRRPDLAVVGQPVRHHQQSPPAGDTDASTRSPTLARRTSAPTASTMPQPSWPGTIGQREVRLPLDHGQVGVADPAGRPADRDRRSVRSPASAGPRRRADHRSRTRPRPSPHDPLVSEQLPGYPGDHGLSTGKRKGRV